MHACFYCSNNGIMRVNSQTFSLLLSPVSPCPLAEAAAAQHISAGPCLCRRHRVPCPLAGCSSSILLPGVLTLTTQTMRGGKSLLNLYPLLGAPSLRQDVWHVKVITCLVGSDVVTEHKVKLKARVGNLFQKHSFVVFVEILFMSRQRSINQMLGRKQCENSGVCGRSRPVISLPII